MTRPFARLATVRASAVSAGVAEATPANQTGCVGGVSRQARAWASRRRVWRAAGSDRSRAASACGQWAVTTARKSRRDLPMVGEGFGGERGQRLGEVDAVPGGFVEEVGERGGEFPGGGQREAVVAGEDEAAERAQAAERVDGGREVERAGHGERGFVGGADGFDAGQQEGRAAGSGEKGGRSVSARTPRRVGSRIRPSPLRTGSLSQASSQAVARVAAKG